MNRSQSLQVSRSVRPYVGAGMAPGSPAVRDRASWIRPPVPAEKAGTATGFVGSPPSEPAAPGESRVQADLPFATAALDMFRHGVALLDANGTVLFQNKALAALMQSDGPLFVWNGKVHVRNSQENRALHELIGRCRDLTDGSSAPCDLSLWGEQGEHSLVVSLMAIDPGASDRLHPGHPAIMLFVIETQPSVQLSHRFLRATFHFSDAEALIARRLLEGATLAEIALTKGTSVATVRSQLKSIMQKTGLGRQSDLINLLSRCDAVIRIHAT